ncbi:hypothetical protein B7463_g10708, partial [Scytalidium lignicola]
MTSYHNPIPKTYTSKKTRQQGSKRYTRGGALRCPANLGSDDGAQKYWLAGSFSDAPSYCALRSFGHTLQYCTGNVISVNNRVSRITLLLFMIL